MKYTKRDITCTEECGNFNCKYHRIQPHEKFDPVNMSSGECDWELLTDEKHIALIAYFMRPEQIRRSIETLESLIIEKGGE